MDIPRDDVQFVAWFQEQYKFYGEMFLYLLAREFRENWDCVKWKAMAEQHEREVMRLREQHFARSLTRYEAKGDINITNVGEGASVEQLGSGRQVDQNESR